MRACARSKGLLLFHQREALESPALPMSSPGMNQGLQQRQTQSLVLAPQLRQSLKISAGGGARSAFRDPGGAPEQPALEELPMESVSLDTGPAGCRGAKAADRGDPKCAHSSDKEVEYGHKREEMDFSKEFEILGKFDDDWRDYMASAGAQDLHGGGCRAAPALLRLAGERDPRCRSTSCGRPSIADISPAGARRRCGTSSAAWTTGDS